MDDRPWIAAEAAVPVIRLPAEIDVTNSGQAHADLAAALAAAGTGQVVADLSQTTFCDSSGVRALFLVHKLAASQGRKLGVVVIADAVLRILELTGLTDVLHLYPTVEAALADRGEDGQAS